MIVCETQRNEVGIATCTLPDSMPMLSIIIGSQQGRPCGQIRIHENSCCGADQIGARAIDCEGLGRVTIVDKIHYVPRFVVAFERYAPELSGVLAHRLKVPWVRRSDHRRIGTAQIPYVNEPA